jgi:hypothetical protein
MCAVALSVSASASGGSWPLMMIHFIPQVAVHEDLQLEKNKKFSTT